MNSLQKYLNKTSPSYVAGCLGVSLQTLRNWKNGIFKPKPDMLVRLEKLSNGAVDKSEIYPELWPKDGDSR